MTALLWLVVFLGWWTFLCIAAFVVLVLIGVASACVDRWRYGKGRAVG